MNRRIALSVLALVTVLLVLAVVPLGLLLGDRERTGFRSAAEASGRDVASVAEEHLSDHKSADAMLRILARTQDQGDCAAVYDASGRVVARTSCAGATGDGIGPLVTAALGDFRTHTAEHGEVLTVAIPLGDTDVPAGVAVLTRSLDQLDDRIAEVWWWLALLGSLGLLAGALVSVALARWVGRPLLAVDRAALRLGEGRLDVRAPVDGGPPEVRRLAATFNTMAARTEVLVHGHRTVIADVSHQLRTPLTALRLRLDLLAGDLGSDAAAELAGVQEEIARLSRLVEGLLAVARAESAVPAPVAVPVDRVVAERVAAWEPVAAERGVSLVPDCRPGLVALLGPEDLEQILDNLLANALDAVPGGGRIGIGGEPHGATVRLTVVDDGPGMSAAAREAAFRRFGLPEAGGTGLGLAIVHRLVTGSGGTARLLDAPGGGLAVELDLPAAERGPHSDH